jgi:hypothetical protein
MNEQSAIIAAAAGLLTPRETIIGKKEARGVVWRTLRFH